MTPCEDWTVFPSISAKPESPIMSTSFALSLKAGGWLFSDNELHFEDEIDD
jgi:hypothetical protein